MPGVGDLSEQERREAVAAVPMCEHAVACAKAKVDGAQAKLAKYAAHATALEDDVRRAKVELAAEEKALDTARQVAQEVLADGPVSIRGQEVRALSGVAGAAAESKDGNS